MSEPAIRLYPSDAAVRRVGTGLLDCTLPRAEWTHEAHLAAALWLLRERPDIAPERDLPGIIRRYNESAGGVNDDTQGYHETLTLFYLHAVRRFHAEAAPSTLLGAVNALLLSEIAPRDWPLRFYSRERLFSVEARRGWLVPDLAELPEL